MIKLHARGVERSVNWSLPQVIAWIVTRDSTRVEALGEESRRARNEPPVGLNEAETSLMFAYFKPMLVTRTETKIADSDNAVKRIAAELSWQQEAVHSCRDARCELLTLLQRGELRVRAAEESQVEPHRFDRAEFADIVDRCGNPHPAVVHIGHPNEPLLTDPLFASEDVVRLWPPPPVSVRAANEAVQRIRRHLGRINSPWCD